MHKLFPTSRWHLKNRFPNLTFVITSAHSRQHTKTPNPNSELDFTGNHVLEELESSKPINPSPQFVLGMENNFHRTEPSKLSNPSTAAAAAQISHPWPEWVDLMVLLLKQGYFDAEGNPFQNVELGPKESNRIRTACLNFARDRYDAMRYLSKKHIQVIAERGCPSTDRKVVNSGKRLRAHVGVDEGNVCSSCNLRGNCERAFVKAREDEGGRTVDVMRILSTYGLDPISGTVENKPCLTRTVKESVRALLKQMAEYGTDVLGSNLSKPTPAGDLSWHSSSEQKGHKDVAMKQGDWHCPKCNFLNFAKNIKCLRCDTFSQERLNQLQEDQDHLPLKKGDWICDKCNFLNFAKNTRCLQCKEKPPKRQLNPGEWECESCNYINFRRNMVCLKCDYRRPKASNAANGSSQWEHDVGSHHRGHGAVDDRNSMWSLRRSSQMRVANRWSFGDGENRVTEKPNAANGSSQWEHDVGSRHRGQEAVEDRNPIWSSRRNSQMRVARSVDEENGVAEKPKFTNSLNDVSGMLDFPIAGGASDLSCDTEKRETWKLKMLERSSMTAEEKANPDEPHSSRIYRKSELLDFEDNEEMAEWFGRGKM